VTGEAVTAPTTLAILLGGSAWPKSPQLAASAAFAASARGFREYLTDARGFGLPDSNILDLFDSAKTAPEIVEDIQNYLRQRTSAQPAPRDLFLYYTGHGGFISGRDYFLAVRSTIEGLEGTSSIRVSDLASALRNGARDVRRYLILDCCFAAAAFKEFQSTPGAAARLQTLDAFPRRGTTLLCSSSSRSVSIAPEGESYTMFSGALLDVLRRGDASIETPLSLEDVGLRVGDLIRYKYEDRGVRPEVHSPDQRDEDIARIPVFPNPGGSPATVAAHLGRAVASPVLAPVSEPGASLLTAKSRVWAAGGAATAVVVIAVVLALALRHPAPASPAVGPTPAPQHVEPAPNITPAPTPPKVVPDQPHPVQVATGLSRGASAPSSTTAEPAATSRIAAKPSLSTTLDLNGTTVRFATIPAGAYSMGCAPPEADCQDDEKVLKVAVDAFQMGVTEVTQEQWQAVMSANPSDFKGPSRPVEHISWDDAQDFLERLNARHDGFVYRLPRESEWEYAARANSAPPALDQVAWFGLAEASGRASRPQAVGAKKANAWGLFDMLGNVAEWCDDWYSRNYQRVVRGGSWQDSAKSVRLSARVGAVPTTHDSWIGLRIVRQPKT
jgi:formylglycine-generating enzyme required for sulfatase activity